MYCNSSSVDGIYSPCLTMHKALTQPSFHRLTANMRFESMAVMWQGHNIQDISSQCNDLADMSSYLLALPIPSRLRRIQNTRPYDRRQWLD